MSPAERRAIAYARASGVWVCALISLLADMRAGRPDALARAMEAPRD